MLLNTSVFLYILDLMKTINGVPNIHCLNLVSAFLLYIPFQAVYFIKRIKIQRILLFTDSQYVGFLSDSPNAQ